MTAVTVDEVFPLVRELYERNAAGGCLHIVLDDGNVEDDHVQFCIKHADENECPRCYALGLILLTMTRDQRHALGE